MNRGEIESPAGGRTLDLEPKISSPRTKRFLVKTDRHLVGLLGIARYLSTDQVNRLLRPGRHESVGRRRLFALAGLGPNAFSPAYLRRVRFRGADATWLDLWALTKAGIPLANEQLGFRVRQLQNHAGEEFLEHFMVLTELFVRISAPYLHGNVRPSALPFHWNPTDTELPWAQYDSRAGKFRQRRLVPDAILELPSVRRRFFVECEMGTHSIVAASDEKTGATLSKVERYDEFFAGYAAASDRLTFYRKSYPDQWPAEVLFLVRKIRRRDAVNAAIENWKKGRTGCVVLARAVTVEDAVSDLSHLLPPPTAATAQTNTTDRKRAVDRLPVLDKADHELLVRFFNDALRKLIAARLELKRYGLPELSLPDGHVELKSFLKRSKPSNGNTSHA